MTTSPEDKETKLDVFEAWLGTIPSYWHNEMRAFYIKSKSCHVFWDSALGEGYFVVTPHDDTEFWYNAFDTKEEAMAWCESVGLEVSI